jgi:hypothetical protein
MPYQITANGETIQIPNSVGERIIAQAVRWRMESLGCEFDSRASMRLATITSKVAEELTLGGTKKEWSLDAPMPEVKRI